MRKSSLIALLLLSVLAVTGCSGWRQRPLAPPGISQVEHVTLGGEKQTIFIRGRDRANPVLLFLHGGPGLPEMPFSHVNADLERDFTVVYWDQLGAGKSYREGIPSDRMSVEHFVSDTRELTQYLCRTFGQRKIYLVGYSWGSLIGALTVSRSPELYRAYIGISQLVNVAESNRWLYYQTIREAEEQGKPLLAARLRQIGEPPYSDSHSKEVKKITASLQPKLKHPMSFNRYLYLGLQSPYYSVPDDFTIMHGLRFSQEKLTADMDRHDLFRDAPEIDVPVWFFLGQYDIILSPLIGEKYYRDLRAPQGKHLILFNNSDHNLHLEEPVRFREELRKILAATRPK